MNRTLAVALCTFTCAFAIAQSRPIADAGITTCDAPAAGGGIGKWVASKQGFSAAAELRAKVTGKGAQRHCTTSWILNVRGADGHTRRITIAEREDVPDDNEWAQENSFEINAWSPDGKLLLVSQVEAQGDWDETTPVIYDFISGQHWRVELHPLFEKLIPTDCYVVYRPLRFSDDDTVIVSALSTDNDREPGTGACFADGLWKVDYRHKTIAKQRGTK